MKKLFVASALIIGASTLPADAGTTYCKEVSSIPFTIKKSGVWCLKKNLTYSGTSDWAIRIKKHNVVLDLNGYRLYGSGGAASQASGIYASNRRNVTVRNGTVEGFYRGVHMDGAVSDSAGHVVEYLRAVGNYFTGIQVNGHSTIIRKNHVSKTGDGDGTNAYGIYLNQSRGAHVYDNTVTHTSETAKAYGIAAISATEIVMRQNMVTYLLNATARYGIHMQSVNDALAYENHLLSSASTTGIRATGSNDVRCIANTIYGFNNTHSTCDTFAAAP